MRKVVPLPQRISFKDEDDITMAINIAKGQLVALNGLSASEISTMVEGESRLDYPNMSEVIKANGKLYERVVIDNKIKLQEIK